MSGERVIGLKRDTVDDTIGTQVNRIDRWSHGKRHVVAGRSRSRQLIKDAFTVQAWVNYNTVGGEQQLITKRVGSSGWSVNKLAAGPANVIEVNAVPNGIGAGEPGGSARSGDAVTDGVWTHVVFRLDGNTPAIFVNNEDNTDSNPCPGGVPCGGWTFSAAHGFLGVLRSCMLRPLLAGITSFVVWSVGFENSPLRNFPMPTSMVMRS